MQAQAFAKEQAQQDPQRLVINSIEDAILQHSHRGMTKLAEFVSPDFCHEAAREILSWERGRTVFLTTGFFVNGYPETDGPAGTMVVARALSLLGFSPVILAEPFARAYYADSNVAVLAVQKSYDRSRYEELLESFNPVGLISIERCGRNAEGDYLNMRGKSVGDLTSSVDDLFLLSQGRIPTIGIGDGGNEIGMGSLLDEIHATLPIDPCVVPVDTLILASVSNWGAYGLTGCLEELTGKPLLPTWDEVKAFIDYTVNLGSVDGVSGENVSTVDGYDITVSKAVYGKILEQAAKHSEKTALASA